MGALTKMKAWFDPATPAEEGLVHYALRMGAHEVPMAERIGQSFSLRFTGQMTCVSCGRGVKKFYGQGFCFPCFRDAPEAAECIVRPDLCRAHLGEGRDPQWEKDHHDTEHFVYLSHTGGIKVGVTRGTQVPTRWIDQGASLAVLIARTPYRQLAGAIEVALKAHFADKTNWRRMLGPVDVDPTIMMEARAGLLEKLPTELHPYLLPNEAPQRITYPLLASPPKVTSINLEKDHEVNGVLAGIKGQYLVFDDGRVLNVRNHSGYHVALE
ncbi:MAG: DUF2797 domain-containing protein [Flavobacteriales bacterium]|nr:DUF2797 domain-containing protein [Flavobacteriales bacterium]